MKTKQKRFKVYSAIFRVPVATATFICKVMIKPNIDDIKKAGPAPFIAAVVVATLFFTIAEHLTKGNGYSESGSPSLYGGRSW